MAEKKLTLGRKVAFYRKQKGLSQKELSLQLGLSESYIGQIERGIGRTGTMNTIQKIADFFGVPLDSLAEDDLVIFRNIENTDSECVRYFSTLSEEKQDFIIKICDVFIEH